MWVQESLSFIWLFLCFVFFVTCNFCIYTDGDPLDAFGDFHAMNELKAMLKPNGIVSILIIVDVFREYKGKRKKNKWFNIEQLLLAVPMWPRDSQWQLLARLYGPVRLPYLVAGWEYAGCVVDGHWSKHIPLFQSWGWHPILVNGSCFVRNICSMCCCLSFWNR